MTIRDILQTEKSAGAGIAARLTEQTIVTREQQIAAVVAIGQCPGGSACTCCHAGCDCGCRDSCPAWLGYIAGKPQRHRGPGSAAHAAEHRALVGPVAAKEVSPVVALLLPPGVVPEHEFHATRRWRFDYAWPGPMVALEIEGGAWTQGRHTRGQGFVADLEKYSEAAIAGWCVLRATPQQLESGEAGALVARALKARAAQ